MKRKLSLLAVLIAMLSLVLFITACGGDENVASATSIPERTITIYAITGKTTTAEAVASVQAAMNKITESKFKTHVVLKLFDEDHYAEALNQAFETYANRDTTPTRPSGSGNTTDVTVEVNEFGRPVTVYPEVVDGQVDIFLIPEGVSAFNFYTNGYYTKENPDGTTSTSGICADLNEHLASNGNSSVLKQYIPAIVLDYCRKDPIDSSSSLYGIPSNRYYADAEYMLVSKSLLEEYNYDPATITDMFSAQSFLCDLAADCKAGLRPGVIPLYNTPGMNLVSVTGRNSVITQYVAENSTAASGMFTPMNIFTIPTVQRAMGFVNEINKAGGIMPRVTDTVDFSVEFGAAFVKGNASIPDIYGDDYCVIMTGSPIAGNEAIYKGIYAVSKFAEDAGYVDRCMEIITLLNTDKEFRNLFGYGVENSNYIIDEETGLVNVINDTYAMDLEETGNMFLLMQNSEMSEEELLLSANNWAYAKATNNHAVVSPYTKFELSTRYVASEYTSLSTYVPTIMVIPELEKLYDEIWIWISEYPTYISPNSGEPLSNFTEYLLVLQKELDKNLYAASASSTRSSSLSIRQQYTNWYAVTYGELKPT